MRLRTIAKRFGRELSCHGNLIGRPVRQNLSMRQAVLSAFGKEQQRAVLSWVTKQGPFWDVLREHSGDDYLECEGEPVTDTAVGEAAYRCLHGAEHRLVSFIPSSWERSPVRVCYRHDDNRVDQVDVFNHWDGKDLESALHAAPEYIQSWKHLKEICVSRYRRLIFADDSFSHLNGHPFVRCAADRILVLLHTLNRFKGCFDQRGERTNEGHEIARRHFAGDKAWFSDSSTTDKNTFKKDLTFLNPTAMGGELFCPWHGKIKTPQYRIHFSWPVVNADTPFSWFISAPKSPKFEYPTCLQTLPNKWECRTGTHASSTGRLFRLNVFICHTRALPAILLLHEYSESRR